MASRIERPPRVAARGTDEALAGRIERTVYHDERSRYTVLRLLVEGEPTLVTAVGRSGALEDGAEVELRGRWGVHPTHGRQFEFDTMHVPIPTTPAGIQRRLTRYPGIREVIAERIVRRFGLDTLDILVENPRRLLEVDGIGAKTLERILAHHESHVGPIAELEAQLVELDLPAHLARPIHERFGDQGLEILRTRPYHLARTVRGIAFRTADRVARALGVGQDSDERIEAGIIYVMEQVGSEGHCALPLGRLLDRASSVLHASNERVQAGLQRLRETGELVVEEHGHPRPLCFLHPHVVAEQRVTSVLVELAGVQRPRWELPELPDHLSPEQARAVSEVAQAGVVVLTGGPGTGKSTVIRNVLELVRKNGGELHLCAPTGRAAKRLEQTTGERASTIHRLLEFQPETGRFLYGSAEPLPPGLVVVDESSMLDLALARSLLDALTEEHRLLLVGDADQLPSVGPGNVLRDLIAAAEASDRAIPVVRLQRVFRQASGSTIVVNAHRILAGRKPTPDERGAGGEFFVVSTKAAEHAHDVVVRLALRRIPEVYGVDPRSEIQILCPMHKGKAGTEMLNAALQRAHASGGRVLELPAKGRIRARKFHVGDRVMQIKNDYGRNVFNGDVGVVVAIDPDQRSLVADFEGVRVSYESKDLAGLQLAYAVSIHKSQGSEFPAVVIPLLTEHHVMLRRNLLYTAVTRARRLCVLVGDPLAIERAVRRADAARRYTGLERRLREGLGAEPHWVAPYEPA